MIYIGIDIGSTAVKAIAIATAEGGSNAKVAGRGSSDYPTHRPEPDAALHDPVDWNLCAVAAVREAISTLTDEQKASVSAISLSAQAGSIYAADENYRPLTMAYTWMDRRAVAESAFVIEKLGADNIRNACGWRAAPTDCIAKLLMLKRREPETFAKARYFLTTEESVTGFLCGNFVTDPTSLVLTRLYDRRNARYIPEALSLLGIDESMLPTVLPCGSEAGRLLPDVANALGIPSGIPVYVGAHDQYCASIGSGVSSPGELLIATGTAWVVFGVSDKIIDSPPHPAWCLHPIPAIYGIMLSLAGCGGALGAFASANGMKARELDRGILSAGFEEMRERIADYFVCPLPPGAPLAHRDGVCGNITARDSHDVYETALAAMEGAAFEARALIEEFAKAGFPDCGEIVISGGASKSELWVSILASVFKNRPLYRLCEPDAPALGAALLAATSNGAYSSLASASEAFTERVLVSVDEDSAKFYEEKYQNYRKYALAE